LQSSFDGTFVEPLVGQPFIVPFSQPAQPDGIVTEETILNDFDGTKCWARPAFVKIGTNWHCRLCSKTYTWNPLTTANIRKHLTVIICF